MSDRERDRDNLETLVERLTKVQEKYTYFILAVCISSIAYTVELTKSTKPTVSMIPLAFAVFFWVMSFICGCWYILNIMSVTRANILILKDDPDQAAYGHHMNRKYQRKGVINFNWQFRFLILGVLCFIFWRALILFGQT